MKKAIRLSLALGALALAMAVPMSGQALHNGSVADCTGTTDVTDECTDTVELSGPIFVSQLESHGNVHSLELSSATVTVEWRDANNVLIYQSVCALTGLSAGGIGVLDAQNFTCANEYVAADENGAITYAPGTQTLRTTITNQGESPVEFHGMLSFSTGDSLI